MDKDLRHFNHTKNLYEDLNEYFYFVSISIETLGSWATEGRNLMDKEEIPLQY